MDEGTKKLLKLFEGYIDEVQTAMVNQDYRRIESETDNTIAILTKIKMKYEYK